MRRLVIGLSVGTTLLVAAGCGGGDKDSAADGPSSASSAVTGSSAPSSPASDSTAPAPSASSESSAGAPPAASASSVTSAPGDSASAGTAAAPCSLLSNGDIRAALGASVSSGAPNSRAQFAGCNYALSGGATLVLYLSTGRGSEIYGATQSGGGFADVSGVGEAAAYNSEDGRFITRAGSDFVELTLPGDLPGFDAQRAQQAGERLAGRVLAQLH